jgi:uncharacterized protein (UPF0218 family)
VPSLPESVRPLLKCPLGKLFSKKKEALDYMRKLHPARLITVGDQVTADFLGAGIKPDIAIIDFLVMRFPAGKEIKKIINDYDVPTRLVKNPPSKITKELQDVIIDAAPPMKIFVEGEEDLATIPAILSAPFGSIVAYGQPKEGVVIVEVTKEKKHEVADILKRFE